MRKPQNFQWAGFTRPQVKLLDQLDQVGNNGWARNSYSDVMVPALLSKLEAAGLSFDRIRQAMHDIDCDESELHCLERYEAKRTTGKFGK